MFMGAWGYLLTEPSVYDSPVVRIKMTPVYISTCGGYAESQNNHLFSCQTSQSLGNNCPMVTVRRRSGLIYY